MDSRGSLTFEDRGRGQDSEGNQTASSTALTRSIRGDSRDNKPLSETKASTTKLSPIARLTAIAPSTRPRAVPKAYGQSARNRERQLSVQVLNADVDKPSQARPSSKHQNKISTQPNIPNALFSDTLYRVQWLKALCTIRWWADETE